MTLRVIKNQYMAQGNQPKLDISYTKFNFDENPELHYNIEAALS